MSKRPKYRLIVIYHALTVKEMAVLRKDHVLALLHKLSNPVRKGIIEALSGRECATFSELLIMCDLDVYYQKGLLDYHLKELCKSGILVKLETGYVLTSLGKIVTQFLDYVKSEYQTLFATKDLIKGGEIVELKIDTFDKEDAVEISMAKYGTKEEAKYEGLWACGNRVPLKAMGWEWGKTVSLIARSDRKIIGVLYGNTIPMHVAGKPGEPLAVIQPTEDKPTNRLEGEIFEIWVHPDYEGQGVERQLIKGFMDHMKERGAIAVIAERVLIENENLLKAFEELSFQKIASHQDFKVKI